jgi:hypothetical protein
MMMTVLIMDSQKAVSLIKGLSCEEIGIFQGYLNLVKTDAKHKVKSDAKLQEDYFFTKFFFTRISTTILLLQRPVTLSLITKNILLLDEK